MHSAHIYRIYIIDVMLVLKDISIRLMSNIQCLFWSYKSLTHIGPMSNVYTIYLRTIKYFHTNEFNHDSPCLPRLKRLWLLANLGFRELSKQFSNILFGSIFPVLLSVLIRLLMVSLVLVFRPCLVNILSLSSLSRLFTLTQPLAAHCHRQTPFNTH